MKLQTRVDNHISIRRATMLVRELSDDAVVVKMDYESALWWLMQAEQAYNGDRDTSLHALIAGTVPRDVLCYVATGRVVPA